MPRFVVDAASLERIGSRLGVLHGQLLSAPTIVGGYDAAMLGGGLLETELDGFTHQWRHAMTAVAGEIDLMQLRLADAGAAYRRIEQRHRETASHATAHTARAGSGSGTTVIDPAPSRHGSSTGSGSGTTVIDPSPSHHASSGSGSGTTVIDGSGSGSGAGTHTGSGSGTTTIGGSGSGSAPAGGQPSGGTGSGSGSGTTVIDGGSSGGSGSGARGSDTTVIGSTRQPVDAGSAGSGFSSPLLSGQEGPAPGR